MTEQVKDPSEVKKMLHKLLKQENKDLYYVTDGIKFANDFVQLEEKHSQVKLMSN